MTTALDVIRRRVKQSPPEGCYVVPDSTPIVAFGKYQTSQASTISLNPSRFEFAKSKKRFHTLKTLEVGSYTELNHDHVDKILYMCDTSFERKGIYYKRWFDPMREALSSIWGLDYLDGTVSHLDISQWATSKKWSDLDDKQKNAIVGDLDIELLRDLIVHGRQNLLIINGATTARVFQDKFGIVLDEHVFLRSRKLSNDPKALPRLTGYQTVIDKLDGLDLGRRVQIYGWNRYIPLLSLEERNTDISAIKSWISTC